MIFVLYSILLWSTVAIIIITGLATVLFMKNLWIKTQGLKVYVYTFLGTFLLLFMGYGCLIASHHFSVDSFNLIFDMIPEWHLSLGRYTNAGVILLGEMLGFNQVIDQRKFMILWLITLTIMIVMIAEAIAKYMKEMTIKKYAAVIVAVALSFLNVFGMELMLFAEMAMVFALSNLTLGLSIYYLLSDMKPLKKWLAITFFLIVSIGGYQSYIGIFVTFSLIGLFMKWQDNIKLRYIESVGTLVLGGGISVANVVFAKALVANGVVADSQRGAGLTLDIILSNLQKIALYQISFWKNAAELLPRGVMPLIGVLVAIIFMHTIKRLSTIEQKIFFVLMMAGCYVLGFAPHIVEAEIALTHRSNIAIWTVISVLFIFGVNYSLECKRDLWKYILNGVLMIAVVANVYIMQDLAANAQSVNQTDIMEATAIAHKMWEHQIKESVKITKIAMINDESPTYLGYNSRYRGDQLGKRVMATSYSQKSLIQYVFGDKLTPVEMGEEVYREHFKGKDWNYMNPDEQVVCIGDTVYIVVY